MARARRSLAVSALVLAAFLVASLPVPAAAVRTVGLSTATFDFSLAPGQTGEGEVIVSNNGDEDIDVLIYASDQLVAEDGSISYEVPSATQSVGLGTPATWMRMEVGAETKTLGNTPYVSLTPGEQIPVAFEIQVPDGAPSGDHQLFIFFEMFGGVADSEGPSANVTGRIGARISIRVAGEVIERMDVRPFVTKGFVLSRVAPYTFVVRNEGNIDKDVDARIIILDGDLQEVVSSLVTSGTPVYAGTNFEQSGAVETGKQLFGHYTMRLEVSYPREGSEIGATDVITVDKGIWFIPLWLVVALILILGSVAIWLSWRKAQSADARERRARRRKYREGNVLVPDDESEAPARDDDDTAVRGSLAPDQSGTSVDMDIGDSRRVTAPRRRPSRRRTR